MSYPLDLLSCPKCGKDMKEGGMLVDGDCEELGAVCIDDDCDIFLSAREVEEYTHDR